MNRTSAQTLRIATALAWEFFARGWQGVLLGPIAALALPGLLFVSVMSNKPGEAQSIIHSFLSALPFYWITILIIGSFIFLNLPTSRHRFTLPASSFLLVAIPMACAFLTMFVQYAIVATTMNAAFDAGWSIVGPGLLAALMVAWCRAVQWSTTSARGVPFLGCVSSFVTLVFVTVRWQPRHGLNESEFLDALGGWQAIGFSLAALACVGIGTVGFAALRRGAGFDGKQIVDSLRTRLWFRPKAYVIPFASATSAQLWLEWNWRGYALPLGMTLLGIVALPLAFFLSPSELHRGQATEIAEGVFTLLIVPVYLIGFFWGNRSRDFGFGPFAGSRPLTDVQIAAAVLKNATLSLIASATIWAVFVALIFLTLGGSREIERLFRFKSQRPDFSPGPILALEAWTAVCCATSLALAGRKAMTRALFLVFGLLFAAYWLWQFIPDGWRAHFAAVYFFVCFAVACLAVLLASIRRRLISWPTIVLAVAIAAAAIAALCIAVPSPWVNTPLLFFACFLLPIPLAAAPLAVNVNRHR